MKYYVKVKEEVKIFVEDLNSECKETILFIHGWPLSHKAYEYQVNEFSKKGYRCIAIDLRGFGDSDKPACGYSYNDFAEDVRSIIKALDLRDITLVGHSMGGAISIRYLSKYDGYGVSRLVLLGAASPRWTQKGDWKYGYTIEEVNQFISDTYKDRPKMLRGITESFFLKQISKPFFDWFMGICLKASGWATAQALESLRDEEEFDDLPKINVPTLILHGVQDEICSYKFAEYMKKEISNSKLVTLNCCGHGLFYEDKEKVNMEIDKFIKN